MENNICSDRKLFDFKYADDLGLLNENLSRPKFVLARLNDNVDMSGISFALSKCRILLQVHSGFKSKRFR